MKFYIGIDNGVTGAVAVLDSTGAVQVARTVPTLKCLNYTKKRQMITRIDGLALRDLLGPFVGDATLVIERPMINPGRWNATVSAIRCDEATLIVLGMLQARYEYIDSQQWQSVMLPHCAKPKASKTATPAEKKATKKKLEEYKANTKKAALEVRARLFPGVKLEGDAKHREAVADALLMAEWARRTNL